MLFAANNKAYKRILRKIGCDAPENVLFALLKIYANFYGIDMRLKSSAMKTGNYGF